jgi:DNA replication licensing factor MCM2
MADSRDYEGNAALDNYDAVDLDDRSDISEMDATARRLAELRMARRDRIEGADIGRKSRAPAFLQSDDEESDASIIGRRRRRHYDDRPEDVEDAGATDLPLEQLGDVKTDSIASWVATDNVRRTIKREFRNFLVTYVDEQGVSVYGARIKTLGERECPRGPQRDHC